MIANQPPATTVSVPARALRPLARAAQLMLTGAVLAGGTLGCLVASGTVARAADTNPAQPGAVATTTANPAPGGNFFDRLFAAYYNDLYPPANTPDAPPAPRLIAPAPLDSPPFPSAEWSYGGTPVLGTDNALPVTPLMQALHGTSIGNALEDSRIFIYGWTEVGANASSSYGKNGNYPAAYDFTPNNIQSDQTTLYLERTPDEAQRDHLDWGFRITGMFGTDYRYTVANGYNSDAYLKRNRQYGFDLPMAYFDLYVPGIGYGTNFRLGRYISLPDIEAQLAPNNYFYSHSLLYTYDPFTQTGLVASTMLDPKGQWIIQYGVSAGNDTSPLVKSAQPTLTLMLRYSTPSNLDNFYVGINSLNDGKFSYNNLQSYYATWYHKFGNSGFHMATEAWYMYEEKTPIAGSDTGFGREGPYGATCRTGIRCFSDEFAVLNYVNYEFDTHDFIGLRNEVFDDQKGQRTGFATTYSEHAISYNHWFSNDIVVRPELRYDHSYDLKAYNNGKSANQETFAADLILKY